MMGIMIITKKYFRFYKNTKCLRLFFSRQVLLERNLCRIQSDISISDLNFIMTRSLILNRQEKISENLLAQMREYLHIQKANIRVILWRIYKTTIGGVRLQSRKEV